MVVQAQQSLAFLFRKRELIPRGDDGELGVNGSPSQLKRTNIIWTAVADGKLHNSCYSKDLDSKDVRSTL